MMNPVYTLIEESHRAGTLTDTLDKLTTLFSQRGSALKVYLHLMLDGWNTIPGMADELDLSQPILYRVTKALLEQELIYVVNYQRKSTRGGPDTRVFNVTEVIQ